MHDRPRLLIVEDVQPTSERLKRLMKRPPADWFGATSRIAFKVDVVATADEARKYVKTARKREQPYEVVLLDLSLPGTKEDAAGDRDDEKNGRELLRYIMSTCDAAVVIFTGYPTTENLIHAVQYGATDFVVKPLETRDDERMLFLRLVSTMGKSRQAASSKRRMESNRQLGRDQERERVSKLVSEQTSQICDDIRTVTELLSRRYGLEPTRDMEDPICKRLVAISEAANEMKEGIWRQGAECEKTAGFRTVDIFRSCCR